MTEAFKPAIITNTGNFYFSEIEWRWYQPILPTLVADRNPRFASSCVITQPAVWLTPGLLCVILNKRGARVKISQSNLCSVEKMYSVEFVFLCFSCLVSFATSESTKQPWWSWLLPCLFKESWTYKLSLWVFIINTISCMWKCFRKLVQSAVGCDVVSVRFFLQTVLYALPKLLTRRICLAIICFILLTLMFDSVFILWGEVRC